MSMYCLHCGDCCLRMSPLGTPCPNVTKIDSFYFCTVYDKRPKQCENHSFPTRYCPIGADVLKLTDISQIHNRVEVGYEMTQKKAWVTTKQREG